MAPPYAVSSATRAGTFRNRACINAPALGGSCSAKRSTGGSRIGAIDDVTSVVVAAKVASAIIDAAPASVAAAQASATLVPVLMPMPALAMRLLLVALLDAVRYIRSGNTLPTENLGSSSKEASSKPILHP